MGGGPLEYAILGSLQVRRMGELLPLGGAKQRAVLALLLVQPNRAVATDELVTNLWPREPPGRPETAVQGYVSELRKLLEPDHRPGEPYRILVTEPSCYRLRLDPGALDAERFATLLSQGKQSLARGRAEAAAADFATALSLWRGPMLAEFAAEPWALAERARLEELRLVCAEERIEAELALGHHAELIGELKALIAEQPLRERLRAQLMRALYRAGRQADALEVYRQAHATLVDELGLDPGPELQALDLAILNQDPALMTSASRAERTNLPAPPNALLGREADVTALEQLLQRTDVRLVTVTGAGGIGKTRLALESAGRMLNRFPDGVWWTALQSVRDPSLVLAAIAQTLGVRGELAAHLADRAVLIVLDNLEQVAEAGTELAALLSSCPGLTLLGTSRVPLHVAAEYEYSLSPLDAANALALFAERARAVRPDYHIIAEANEICRRLDGLPLAIELAAAWTKALPLHQILERLKHPLPLLVGGPRDSPARHQTLTAAIGWSYDLLSAAERRLFIRLSVFSGGCTLDAAEAVCGADLATLAALVDKSLLQREGERYQMLETIREYAWGQLSADSSLASLRLRHAAYFLTRLERTPMDESVERLALFDRRKDLVGLEPDHENVRAAIEWSLEQDDAQTALRLVAGAYPLWRRLGYWAPGAALARRVLRLPSARAATLQRADALTAFGDMASSDGNLEDARSALEESVAIYRALREESRLAWALYQLAGAHYESGAHQKAVALTEEALRLAPASDQTAPDELTESLALFAGCAGDLRRARLLLEEGLRRRRGKPRISATLHRLSTIELMSGDYERSAELLAEAMGALDPELGVTFAPRLAISLALNTTLRGDPAGAASFCAAAIEGARAQGDRIRLAHGLAEMALIRSALGQDVQAARLFGAAEALRSEIGTAVWEPLRPHVETARARTRARLGDTRFATAAEVGRSASLENAIDDALGPERGRERDSRRHRVRSVGALTGEASLQPGF